MVGVALPVVLRPSWPNELSPQLYTVPAEIGGDPGGAAAPAFATPPVKNSPTERVRNTRPPATATGEVAVIVVPSANSL